MLMAPLTAEHANYGRAFTRYNRLEQRYKAKLQARASCKRLMTR